MAGAGVTDRPIQPQHFRTRCEEVICKLLILGDPLDLGARVLLLSFGDLLNLFLRFAHFEHHNLVRGFFTTCQPNQDGVSLARRCLILILEINTVTEFTIREIKAVDLHACIIPHHKVVLVFLSLEQLIMLGFSLCVSHREMLLAGILHLF